MNEPNLTAIQEEEDDVRTGYATIIPSPRNSGHFDFGVPFHSPKVHGSSVIVNSYRQPGNFRRNSWNANPRSSVIIQELGSLPWDDTPRIVEVTESDEEQGIANPDYPRSERGDPDNESGYPTLPSGDISLPVRDYSRMNSEESRPDIQRIDLGAPDHSAFQPTPLPAATIPPAPPPPPIVAQGTGRTDHQPVRSDPPPTSDANETDGATVHQSDTPGRAPEAANESTQPSQDVPDGEREQRRERRHSREIYTQTRGEQQSAEVQTTLEHPRRRETRDSRPNERSRPRDSHREERQSGPRFGESGDPEQDRRRSQGRFSGADFDNRGQRSSTVIERIIITREIDPATGRPVEPVQQSNIHHNVIYNRNTVRGSSGRRSRPWSPFGETHGVWSPHMSSDQIGLTGIVAGMEEDPDAMGHRFSQMPGEPVGRSNRAYNVSPRRERRRQPEVVRTSGTHHPWEASAAWTNVSNNETPPPPPYTERDLSPTRGRTLSFPANEPTPRGWARSSPNRARDWRADSEISSSTATSWSRRTRVIFAVMLLLCILLLLALVIVVTLYFTVGPGSTCLNGPTCEPPPLGYIIAFAVIGILALFFMIIGILLCCFAWRISREKRRQHYHVTPRT